MPGSQHLYSYFSPSGNLREMKVQVVSKEAIRPSTPTPAPLRWMPLSMLDQVAPPIYIHILLFYSANSDGDAVEKGAHLKKSLSVALTQFYPLAGRIRGPLSSSSASVECNDEGADFYEASVEGDLDPVLRHPPMEELHHLLPADGAEAVCDGRALLAVQFNQFDCGGSALGVSVSHLVADGTSMALLLRGWADAACGRSVRCQPRFHAASLFPPDDLPAARGPPFSAACSEAGAVPKRFVIGGQEVEKLRSGKSYGARDWAPTRVEAVSSLVWRCAARASGGGPQIALHAVNLRKKMGEKLGEDSFGNLWADAVVLWEGDIEPCGSAQGLLEKKVRDAVGKVDERYARAAMARGAVLPEIGQKTEMGRWIFSSWCRFSLYETDLGWGRPAWVSCALRDMNNVAILMDASDGKGIEVWLWLGEEEMGRFEGDPEVVEFFSTTI